MTYFKISTDDTRVTVSTKGLHVFDTVANSLVPSTYDTIVINYTYSTKGTVSSVVFKLGATTISTLTPTFAGTSDTWTKS